MKPFFNLILSFPLHLHRVLLVIGRFPSGCPRYSCRVTRMGSRIPVQVQGDEKGKDEEKGIKERPVRSSSGTRHVLHTTSRRLFCTPIAWVPGQIHADRQ
jgi:hypothetical protein